MGDGRATVLVVDDDSETADLYAEYLDETYAVRTAYSGEEALDAVDSDVDVVLLDRRMPGLSGDDVLDTIRERGIACRVVMVTALEPDVDILALPFDDYLVKPVSRESLCDAVSRMIRRNECDAEIQEMIAIASKMATLESKLTLSELNASPEYAALEDQFADMRARTGFDDPTDEEYAEFTSEKIGSLLD